MCHWRIIGDSEFIINVFQKTPFDIYVKSQHIKYLK